MKKFLSVLFVSLFVLSATQVRAEEKKAAPAKTEEKKDAKKSDADVLKERAEGLTKALQKSDINTVMGFFADDFTSPMIKDKAALKALLELGSNSGTFSGLTVDNSKTKYTVDGEKATVGPSTFDASGESGTATFTCVKKGGEWKIVGLDLTGVSL